MFAIDRDCIHFGVNVLQPVLFRLLEHPGGQVHPGNPVGETREIIYPFGLVDHTPVQVFFD